MSASGAQSQSTALNVNKDQSRGLHEGSLVTFSLRRQIQFSERFPTLKIFAPGLQSQQLACNFCLIYFEPPNILSQSPGFVYSTAEVTDIQGGEFSADGAASSFPK